MPIGIAGDNPAQVVLNQQIGNQDLLDQILNELRTLTAGVYSGLNVTDDPNSYRTDPSNSNPNLS